MKINLNSIFVQDQERALEFYTEKLGFVKKHDVPVGQFKWLTVVSSEEPEGTELLLEPNDNPLSKTFQKGIFEQGIAAISFQVDDINTEYEKLEKLGVKFTMPPTKMGEVIIAILDDTCGNLVQIMEKQDTNFQRPEPHQ